MPTKSIVFTHTGHAHAVGNFQAGDKFTGDAELCRHFVEDAGCAQWVQASAPAPKPAANKPPRKTATQRKEA